ncbi:MAG TPA: shikimate dehydrogenase [Solirubrobacteraceae bacterium]|nr:shikimate dehydrogenase [Solirubrobacteraceae bacterium]
MHRLGVLGWPVAHSRSPAMQRAAFAELGLRDWSYQLLPVPPELLVETVRALGGAGFVGANVTVPHKEAALALADEATLAARAIGAANTLSFAADGTIAAENTDAPGLLDALAGIGRDPAGSSALVLGAGGSARAVVWGLREAGADVGVWNRTPERARRLAAELGVRAVERAEPADILVNCTTVGLDGYATGLDDRFTSLPVSADELDEYACLIDLVYGDRPTALLSAAQARGLETVDGLEILVCQGARSFTTWTGRGAPLAAMRTGARRAPRIEG